MSWKENAAMYWSTNNGTTWTKVTDHNRSPLDISVERIEHKQRMADGTLRRYVVAKKRTFTANWDMLPTNTSPESAGTVDGGLGAKAMETFHNENDGAFLLRLKAGDDRGKAIGSSGIEEYRVMISDFTKTIVKRGVSLDMWDISITLEEV